MPAKSASSPVKPAHVRMARAALDWSLEDLAQASGLNRNMIASFERGIYEADAQTLAKVRASLETGGVEFLMGEAPGVRLKARRR